MNVTKSMEETKAYIVRVLTGKGVPPQSATVVAESLVFADARGTKSHGLNMLAAYLNRIDQGGIDVQAIPKTLREDNSTTVLDGANGFGQVGVQALVDLLLEKVTHAAVVCGSVRHINHCGALAYYTEQVARKGYIAFLFANANPTVAPFGGMEAVLGTNPMSVALPFGDAPVVLDMASSAVAKAKIYHAAKMGQKIDPTWALDSDGNPTDDPQKAIDGVLTAMGGPKGYGLALVVETLAGVLSGGGVTSEVSSVHKRAEQGMNAGAFMILIDPAFFLDKKGYEQRMEKLVSCIKASKPQPNRQIFLPGEIEQAQYLKSNKNGIEYDNVFFET